eukprot:4690-Heterococcus_DN1.PRE.2
MQGTAARSVAQLVRPRSSCACSRVVEPQPCTQPTPCADSTRTQLTALWRTLLAYPMCNYTHILAQLVVNTSQRHSKLCVYLLHYLDTVSASSSTIVCTALDCMSVCRQCHKRILFLATGMLMNGLHSSTATQ